MNDKFETANYYAFHELSKRIAEAIEAVLEIDVTIMNKDLIRIAGTGRYRQGIGEKIERKTAFEYCLLTGEAQIIIKGNGDHPICLECPRRSTCTEKAEICVPILFKKDSVGVIGIIAFESKQKEKIVTNKQIYLNFVQKMASLLEAKYSEIGMQIENKVLSGRLNAILNTINEGLIVFTAEGQVLYKNHALGKLFAEMGIDNKQEFIKKIWRHPVIAKLMSQQVWAEPHEIMVEHHHNKYGLLASLTTMQEKEAKEIIITLQNLKKIEKRIIQAVEKNQVKLQFQDIKGISPLFLDVKRLSEQAAIGDSNILILGESGTGKELFARAIHNKSQRREFPFVPLNCGAIPDELLESELFGYEKGAFTGAYTTKIGKFEVAENGTIFLDEISEMPYRLQVKLLRILQEKEICRIGSNKIRTVNVRVIAATNKDLRRQIERGLFREDLYYRLNVIPISIPPLRKRKKDILYMTEHFVKYYAKMLKKDVTGLSEEAQELFLLYDWPGNVRELQNVIEFAVTFATDTKINSQLIKKRLNISQAITPPQIGEEHLPQIFSKEPLSLSVQRYEKEIITRHLQHCWDKKYSNVVKRICEELNISRATFYRKVKELGISLNNEKVSK